MRHMHKGKLSFRYEFSDTPNFVKVNYTVPIRDPMRNGSDDDFTKHTFKKAGLVRPNKFKRCVPPAKEHGEMGLLDIGDSDISELYEYVCGGEDDTHNPIANTVVESVVRNVLHNCHDEPTKSHFSGLDFLMNADLDELTESIVGDTKHVLYGNDGGDVDDGYESDIDLDLCMDLTLGDTKNELYPNGSMAWMDSFDDPWMDPWMLNKV